MLSRSAVAVVGGGSGLAVASLVPHARAAPPSAARLAAALLQPGQRQALPLQLAALSAFGGVPSRGVAQSLRVPRAAAIYEETGEATGDEPDESIYECEYDPDYHNFVALTGTATSLTVDAERASFLLQVAPKVTTGQQPLPPSTFWIEAYGPLIRALGADMAAQLLTNGMVLAVQGELQTVTNPEGQQVTRIIATNIGKVLTPSAASVVAGAPEAANPQQFAAHLAVVQQQQPAQASAASSGSQAARGPLSPPAMPANPTTERERQWVALFQDPSQWWDNRADGPNPKRNPRAPDFKHKQSGAALWLESAPAWAQQGMELLPGGRPYVPDPNRQARAPSAAPRAAADMPFLPAEAGSQAEAAWMEVFRNYGNFWDNRLNKRNPKAPDFKAKTGELALWLSSKNTPPWVTQNLAQLPAPPPPRG